MQSQYSCKTYSNLHEWMRKIISLGCLDKHTDFFLLKYTGKYIYVKICIFMIADLLLNDMRKMYTLRKCNPELCVSQKIHFMVHK